MKIVQIITLASLGGAQTVVYELSNSLVSKGHDVTVIAAPDGELWNFLDQRIRQVKCPFFKREISPLNDIKAILFLKKIISREKFDIIHLHSSKAGVWGRLACTDSLKIIYTVHGFDTILKANKIFLFVEKYLAKRCRYLVAVSDYDKKNLAMHGIYNTITIKNGVNDCRLSNVQNIFTKHKNKDSKIIVSIARLQPQKKFDMFIEVAKRLKNENYVFYWIGNQYEIQNLPENVYCLGSIKNAGSYIAYADLFVLFSNYEGLPISILEAFSSSVPVVASNVGGISELLNGKNGLAIENDIDTAVSAIKKYTTGNIMHYKIAARKTYEKEFTLENMVDKYIDIYRECL